MKIKNNFEVLLLLVVILMHCSPSLAQPDNYGSFYCDSVNGCSFLVILDTGDEEWIQLSDAFERGEEKQFSIPEGWTVIEVQPFVGPDQVRAPLERIDFYEIGIYKGKIWGTRSDPKACITLYGVGCYE